MKKKEEIQKKITSRKQKYTKHKKDISLGFFFLANKQESSWKEEIMPMIVRII